MYNICTHSISCYAIDKYKTSLFLKPIWAGIFSFVFVLKGGRYLMNNLATVSDFSRNNLNVSLRNAHYSCLLEMEIKFLFLVILSLYILIIN